MRREEKWEGPPERGLVGGECESLAGERAGAGCPVALVGEEESKGRRDCGGAAAAPGAGGCSPILENKCIFFRVF